MTSWVWLIGIPLLESSRHTLTCRVQHVQVSRQDPENGDQFGSRGDGQCLA